MGMVGVSVMDVVSNVAVMGVRRRCSHGQNRSRQQRSGCGADNTTEMGAFPTPHERAPT
jgi:hypothetical protein